MLRLGSAVTLSLLVLGAASDSSSVDNSSAPRRVADTSTAPSDTLTFDGATGTPLVRTLPTDVNGTSVTRYVVLDGPALSGTAGRSFTWIPRDASSGTYNLRLQANHADTAPDTLLLTIKLES